jgi:simple sugar transport system permease protein
MTENVIQGIFSAAFLASLLRITTPILLPSLGALLSDRAGVINIGMEGIMLASAFTGVIVSVFAPAWLGPAAGPVVTPWLSLALGILIGVLMALLLGFFHLKFKGNIILAGIALNVLGSSASVAVMYELTGDKANTASLKSMLIPFIQLPPFIADIPIIGRFFYDVFNNQSVMTWIAFLSIGFVWYLMYRTPFGKHLRASGEHPQAAESVGIRVTRTRYMALALSGMFAAMGGIHMSMGYLNLFQRDMTAGRGFIALATPLLGGNHPVGTGLASLVFGFFDTLAIRIGTLQIPSQIPQMIPYLAAVMALVIYALQTKTRLHVRALRAAEGEHFDASFWNTIQRLSTLHIAVMMVAVIGVIVSISMLTIPNGFGGPDTAYPLGVLIGLVSIIILAANAPFVVRVERISHRAVWGGLAAVMALVVYLALFLAIFTSVEQAVLVGLVAALLIWLALGGWHLIGRKQPGIQAA